LGIKLIQAGTTYALIYCLDRREGGGAGIEEEGILISLISKEILRLSID